ncbi:hypothetical protein Pla52o_56230 [Novipirellula galeiformis]|uniref:Chromosome partition protein Smc n=1 Tax=Novipirellula galeiformis TaxID=2528004 RepID=A0A5C6BG84_9BACT|nr:hypothetical protein [Novipirellula galeiformis]TWU11185.1 hypothetical protein Pla52o_56230 [Novipirellula galeiformis]
MIPTKTLTSFAIAFSLGLLFGGDAFAQESNLPERQTGVATRYERLEELLLRLAEIEGAENPERAALLRRAARQSRDQFVLSQLKDATEALRSQRFQEAVDKQKGASEGLQGLLQLLMSEDRSKRIRDEKERIANLIKDLKRVERSERSTRARNENGADLKEVQAEQEAITKRSEALRAELSDQDAEDSSAEEKGDDGSDDKQDQGEKKPTEPGEKSDSPQDSKDPKSGDAKSDDGKSAKGDNMDPQDPSEQKSGDSGDPSENKPSDSEAPKPSDAKPSDSKPSDSKPSGDPLQSPPSGESPPESSASPQDQAPSPQSPQQQAEQQLQEAIEKMKEAEQELEQNKRADATEKQREAEDNLREAIDRLERILRQLREEEMQRELAKLEARLRRMAAMQSKVLDDTIALAATPQSQRNRQTDLKAGDLAFEEKKITLEADRAMLLLREEGSSVAFPEVVSQIRLDTTHVAERLSETKIDAVTQGIQQDILAALEEMIAATQKAQRDLEKKQQQQQGQPQQGGKQEQPLVEALAELKLIRTMETRIKTSTSRYADLLELNESTAEETLPLLQDLSERQNRLYQITRDLVLKRNQ